MMRRTASSEPLIDAEQKLLSALLYFPEMRNDVKSAFTNSTNAIVYRLIIEWSNVRIPIPIEHLWDRQSYEGLDEDVLLKIEKEYNKIDRSEAKVLIKERVKLHNFLQEKNSMLKQAEDLITHISFADSIDEIEMALQSLEVRRIGNVGDIRTHINNVFSDTEYIMTGISEIDQDIGISKGTLLAIMADTGMQKTMFTVWWLLRMLEVNPTIRVAYFEKEMVENEIAKRVLSYLIRTPSTTLLSNKDKAMMDWGNYSDENKILERFVLVGANQFNNAYDISKIIERENIDVWVLDYLTELEQDDKNYNYETYIKQQVTILKKTINKLNNVGIILSQIKHTADLHGKSNKITHPEDMEYGKTLRQNSSYIFSLFHPNYYDETVEKEWLYLIPHKVRDRAKIEVVQFLAFPSICNYESPSSIQRLKMENYLQEYKRGKRK